MLLNAVVDYHTHKNSPSLLDSHIACMYPAAATCTLAALRTWTRTIDSSGSSSVKPPSHSATHSLPKDVLTVCSNWTAGIVRQLTRYVSTGALPGLQQQNQQPGRSYNTTAAEKSDEHSTTKTAAAQALLSSADVQQLAALQVASVAQLVHSLQQQVDSASSTTDSAGRSAKPHSSSDGCSSPRTPKGSQNPRHSSRPGSPTKHVKQSRSKAVLPHHCTLLAHLGLQEVGQQLADAMSHPDVASAGLHMTPSLAASIARIGIESMLDEVTCYLHSWVQQGGLAVASAAPMANAANYSTGSSSSSSCCGGGGYGSSSSGNSDGTSSLVDHLPGWLLPTLCTLCETAVSWPDGNSGLYTCLSVCGSLLEAVEAAASSLACRSDVQAQQAAAAMHAATAGLAQPMLHMLGLAMVRHDSAAVAAADEPCNTAAEVAQRILNNFMRTKHNSLQQADDKNCRGVQLYAKMLAALLRAGM
jgi:hypothetical protein